MKQLYGIVKEIHVEKEFALVESGQRNYFAAASDFAPSLLFGETALNVAVRFRLATRPWPRAVSVRPAK